MKCTGFGLGWPLWCLGGGVGIGKGWARGIPDEKSGCREGREWIQHMYPPSHLGVLQHRPLSVLRVCEEGWPNALLNGYRRGVAAWECTNGLCSSWKEMGKVRRLQDNKTTKKTTKMQTILSKANDFRRGKPMSLNLKSKTRKGWTTRKT